MRRYVPCGHLYYDRRSNTTAKIGFVCIDLRDDLNVGNVCDTEAYPKARFWKFFRILYRKYKRRPNGLQSSLPTIDPSIQMCEDPCHLRCDDSFSLGYFWIYLVFSLYRWQYSRLDLRPDTYEAKWHIKLRSLKLSLMCYILWAQMGWCTCSTRSM